MTRINGFLMPERYEIHMTELAEYVSVHLGGLARDRSPAQLYDSVRYVLDGGGKRIRPVLLLLSAKAFGVSRERVLPLALAVELVHNFSLVHDDIMDHAASRRGRPSVHVAWSPETALLCGDVLLSMAAEQVAQTDAGELRAHVECFARAVGALCEGQVLDKHFEEAEGVTTSDYLAMIDLKTGALITASLVMGGIAGGATEAVHHSLSAAGQAMGRAFQIQDDLLDLTANSERWGKVVGSDLIEGKKTYLLLEAQARAEGVDQAFFGSIRHGAGLRRDQIDEVRNRMAALGVLDAARDAVALYTAESLRHLKDVAANTGALQLLVLQMAARMH